MDHPRNNMILVINQWLSAKKNDPIYIKKSTVQKGGAIMQPPPLGSNECLGRGE